MSPISPGYKVINPAPVKPLLLEVGEIILSSRPPSRSTQERSDKYPAENIQLLIEQLDKAYPDCGYETWRSTIWGGISGWGEEAIPLLEAWSRGGDKWDSSTFDKVVSSFSPEGGSTSRSVYWAARENPLLLDLDIKNRELVELAYSIALEELERWGNTPSAATKKAIRAILEGMVWEFQDNSCSYRYVYPLDTGLGKTTCSKALIVAMDRIGDTRGIIYASELIDQLEEAYSDLIRLGVDKSKIGIFHNDKDRDTPPSIQAEELEEVQFVLTTHMRFRHRYTNKWEVLEYKGGIRELAIWDEKLIKSSGSTVNTNHLINGIDIWTGNYEMKVKEGIHSRHEGKGPVYEEFYSFLKETRKIIMDGEIDEVLKLPSLSAEYGSWDKISNNLSIPDTKTTLQEFVDMVSHSAEGEGRIRLVKANNKPSCISYELLIPSYMPNMVIQDASASISELVKYDNDITIAPIEVRRDHSDVIVYGCNVGSSRHALKDRSLWEEYMKETIKIIKEDISQEEKVLIFVLVSRDGGIDFMTEMEERLIRSLIYGDRVKVITWGSHRGTNKFSGYKNFINCGMVYRDCGELAASILGQKENLSSPVGDQEVRRTQLSEQADSLYQGMSRGSLRTSHGEKAGAMRVWFFHREKDQVQAILRHRCGGIQIEQYTPRYLGRTGEADYLKLAREISNMLDTVETECGVGEVKRETAKGLPEVNITPRVWRDAKHHFLANTVEWSEEGRNRGAKFIRSTPSLS